MGVFHAAVGNFLGGVAQVVQQFPAFPVRHPFQDPPGDFKDGPIVDFQDSFPSFQGLGLGPAHSRSACLRQGLDIRAGAGKTSLKNHSVSYNRDRHTPGLRRFRHSQQFSQNSVEGGPGKLEPIQYARGPVDPALQGLFGVIHRQTGKGCQANQVSQISQRTGHPPGHGKAGNLRNFLLRSIVILLHPEHAVRKPGVPHRLLLNISRPHRFGVAQGDGGLDALVARRYPQAEAVFGLLLHVVSGVVFSLNHYRRTPRSGNKHVGSQEGLVGNHAGVLGQYRSLAQHRQEQIAQKSIGVVLNMARRHFPFPKSRLPQV